jgi:hypothetical protein
MMVGTAAMTNVRRINHYRGDKMKDDQRNMAAEKGA